MERIWMKSWPGGVDTRLTYRLGERPLFEYLRQNAEDFPEKTAYIYYGREITWKELDESSDRFARFLLERGVGRGDRIVLFLQNCPQYVIAHYGIQKAGAVVAPASPMFKEWELEYEVNDLEARMIVTAADLFPIVENIRERTPLKEVVVTAYRDMIPDEPTIPLPAELERPKTACPGAWDLLEVLQTYPAEVPPWKPDLWNDVYMIVYTSGTTGRPKGAMLTYGNALFKVAGTYHFNRTRQDDIRLTIMPICHIAGNNQGLGLPVYGGITTVLLTRFDPEAALIALERYRCTLFSGTTPMLTAMMRHPQGGSRDLRSLRHTFCVSFGTPLTEAIAADWRKFTAGSPVYEAGYGLSETHTADTYMPWDKGRYGCNGIPIFDTDFKILEVGGSRERGVNESGEIAVRNPGVFKGYWKNPEATAATLRDGWVHTGDIGYFDEDGYLHFVGRIKEMIKCSGYSVFPEDVEVMLLRHPAVAQAGVIGVPDPLRGESVKAFIVLHPEFRGKVSEAELIAWAKEKMAAYKYPRAIEFRDFLPATATGKILRRVLKEEEDRKRAEGEGE